MGGAETAARNVAPLTQHRPAHQGLKWLGFLGSHVIGPATLCASGNIQSWQCATVRCSARAQKQFYAPHGLAAFRLRFPCMSGSRRLHLPLSASGIRAQMNKEKYRIPRPPDLE